MIAEDRGALRARCRRAGGGSKMVSHQAECTRETIAVGTAMNWLTIVAAAFDRPHDGMSAKMTTRIAIVYPATTSVP